MHGFYWIGKLFKSKHLKFASSFFMIVSPIYAISTFLTGALNADGIHYLSQLIVSLLGINCILFGIGLTKIKTGLQALYKITGILQIVIAPFFIIPVGILNVIACYINIPYYILLITILYLEYKRLTEKKISN